MSGQVVLIFPGSRATPFPGLPVALAVLSGVLERAGWNPLPVDLRVQTLDAAGIASPVCVGIGAMTGSQILAGIRAARWVRERFPGVPIVWGGVHPTMLPEETLKHPCVDVVLCGEGEETLPELAAAFRRRAPLSGVRGIAYKDETGHIRVNSPRDWIDLDSLPVDPPYDRLPLSKYAWQFFVQTSRGCPHRCGYCYNTFYCKRQYRTKSVPRVLEEVAHLAGRFKLAEVGFDCDDAFFCDLARVRAICEGLLEKNLRIRWTAPARFDYFARCDEDFIRLLVRSGCSGLTFGGDSGSPRILGLIGKDIEPGTMLAAAEKLRAAAGDAVAVDVNFIFGFPTETRGDFDQTLALMEELGKILPRIRYGVTLYTPYPGTPLYPLALESGFRPPDSLEGWGRHELGTFRAPWLSSGDHRRLMTLSCMSRVDFFSDRYAVPSRFSRVPDRWAYRGLSALAHWRWRRRAFGFPVEWEAVRRYVELRRGYF